MFLLLSTILARDASASDNEINNNNNMDRFAQADDAMRLAREQAKPWLMRELVINGTRLYISPVSIITILVFVTNLWGWLVFQTSGTWAEASHILVKDTSKKTHKALVGMQKDIGGNLKLFAEMAEKYSQCPSSKEKGDLGRFKQGDMAPPFDRAVFDPNTPLNTTIGPIETQFGYHLIYVRNRKL
jgi:peptidyl-prolyl cis-trans isomerase C